MTSARLAAALLAGATALSACSTTGYVSDGEPVDPNQAYLLLVSHFRSDQLDAKWQPFVGLMLARIDPDGTRHRMDFSVEPAGAGILRMPAGTYEIEEAVGIDFHPGFGRFVVKAGRVNYVGDWWLSNSRANLGIGGKPSYCNEPCMHLSTQFKMNPQVGEKYAHDFPKMAVQLPLEIGAPPMLPARR